MMPLFKDFLALFRQSSTPTPAPPEQKGGGDWLAVSRWILKSEGDYSDRADDHGGPTNMGITIPTLSNWRGHQCTADDVKYLTTAEALTIYHTNYWHAMRCDELPHGVNLIVMDVGVMSGQGRAIKLLQQAVGAEQDGILGDATMAAISRLSPAYIVSIMSSLRSTFYRSLNQPANERGWLARVDRTKSEANSLIA